MRFKNDTVFFIRHQIFLNESGVFLCVKTCYLYLEDISDQNGNTDTAWTGYLLWRDSCQKQVKAPDQIFRSAFRAFFAEYIFSSARLI